MSNTQLGNDYSNQIYDFDAVVFNILYGCSQL